MEEIEQNNIETIITKDFSRLGREFIETGFSYDLNSNIKALKRYDKGILKDIEKAINMSDLGLVPMNDGNLIRMAIPQLTEQRRKDLVKVVNKKAEEAKVAIRNIRRDGNVFLKKEEKNSDISKDVIKDMEDKIQKLTDQKIKDLEAVTDKKVEEILSV